MKPRIETGVLDEEFFPTVMRPMARFVTGFPVAPNNPMASPLRQIEAPIEEQQVLQRIYRQRSGEDETAAIGELGEMSICTPASICGAICCSSTGSGPPSGEPNG